MALSNVFRRASSTVATLAFRAVRSPVTIRSGALSADRLIFGSQLRRGSVSSVSRFSTGSAVTKKHTEENLVSAIESEIECAMKEEEPRVKVVEDKPEGFPFEIIDTPGLRTVWLERHFKYESIYVKVEPATFYGNEVQESLVKIRIPMFVLVGKGDGVFLAFRVSAYTNEIVIDSLSIEGSNNVLAYEGPDFDDLDENLQKAFHRYLEIRGINPSFTNFLEDYVINKESREFTHWLKNLKSFVEK